MIYDLVGKCEVCQLPSLPNEKCPRCQLLDPNYPGVQMQWKQRRCDFMSTSYSLDGPIYVFVGRWENPGPKNGMWHVRIENDHFFLPKNLSDAQVLRQAEQCLEYLLGKMLRSLKGSDTHNMIPIVPDED